MTKHQLQALHQGLTVNPWIGVSIKPSSHRRDSHWASWTYLNASTSRIPVAAGICWAWPGWSDWWGSATGQAEEPDLLALASNPLLVGAATQHLSTQLGNPAGTGGQGATSGWITLSTGTSH